MKQTFLDSCHMLYGNKGAVWTDSVHICEVGFNSSTLCGVPMLATNWAAEMNVTEPGCLKCRLLYTLKSVTREDMIKICANNDHNGTWTDEQCIAEGMQPATKDDLSTVMIMWVIEGELDENDINDLLKPYAKLY